MTAKRYAITLVSVSIVLFLFSHAYNSQTYSPSSFWEARLETPATTQIEEEKQYHPLHDPVSDAIFQEQDESQPLDQVPEEFRYTQEDLQVVEEAIIEEQVKEDEPIIIEPEKEVEPEYTPLPLPEPTSSSSEEEEPISSKEETINRRLPTFHILSPPRSIQRSLAECSARCRSRSGRLSRREMMELDERQYTMSTKALEKAYGSPISFPIKGDFPYTLRNTTQFSLKRIFDLRLSLLPNKGITRSNADFIYFSIDGEALRNCEKCAQSLHAPRPEVRNELQAWLIDQTSKLAHRKAYPSLLLVLPRIWHAYMGSFLTEPAREALSEDGVVFNIELGTEESKKALVLGSKKAEMVQVPYPTMFHLKVGEKADEQVREWMLNQERSNLLACSLGRLDVMNVESSRIRKAIAHQLADLKRDDLYFSFHYDPEEAYTAMSQSTFCLQPPGDSATRRGFFDSIMLGCIPVIFHSDVYQPFGSPLINVEDFAYVISEEDAFADTKSGSRILQRLEAIPKEEIRQRQEGLARLAPRIQYAFPTSNEVQQEFTDDAFGLLLAGLADLRDSTIERL